jgi:hypothetical protein
MFGSFCQQERKGRMPIRTVKTTPEQKKELVQLCHEYADLQKKAVEIRWVLNDQVAALAGLMGTGEVAGLSIDFTQIEVVSVEEWKEALLNVATSERWVCTGFAPTETDLRTRKVSIETIPSVSAPK